MYVCLSVCLSVCMYVCMYVYLLVHVSTCICNIMFSDSEAEDLVFALDPYNDGRIIYEVGKTL